MAGRPRKMAARIGELVQGLEEWGERFRGTMPEMYKSSKHSADATCVLWQEAANRLADHYHAVHKLHFHLVGKAMGKAALKAMTKYQPSAAEPDEFLEPEVRPDDIVEVDGEQASLAEWCQRYGISIDTVRQRIEQGWDVEEAIVVPVDDEDEEAGSASESG